MLFIMTAIKIIDYELYVINLQQRYKNRFRKIHKPSNIRSTKYL